MRLRDMLQTDCGLRLVVGEHQLERRISWVYATDLGPACSSVKEATANGL